MKTRIRRMVRPVADPLRETTAVKRVGELLGRRAYRVGRPAGIVDRALARIVTFLPPTPEHSTQTCSALVELFFELVESTGVQRFVEAGAKDAGASVRAAKDLGIGDVTAFEANPYTHRRFVARVSAAGVDYQHLALGEAEGDVTFLVRLTADGKPMADGQGSVLVRPDHLPGYEEVTVPSTALDTFYSADKAVPTAMWIDVEGASSIVLRGARALLRSVDVAIIEVESARKWRGQEWVDHDVVRFFMQHGLEPIGRDRQSREQYNIVFARRSRPGVASATSRWRTSRT